ncbi:copper transporter family protein [Aspergillus homomorphus CBS 101889]|uniref:Copper transport protein n=1 Tax=Aspergillus homomorphus (strain CBS 101889) TaxID=1450537 RepID=A0A395I797_ASPHC|nr:Ctr-domain-containing protein [Aspergillus homomorphus CBS 101889]RAL15795.1 Ctr-domain-containing protein [Aspergillus homomorphus CBS 101889]
MLWNWTTIDACFLTSSWHISTAGQFAVSCIGVAFLVVVLDFLRLLGKQYEERLQRQFQRHVAAQTASERMQFFCGDSLENGPTILTFRASPLQQLIRALLHTLQFGLAYLIMLIAMFYNGYMIISIFLGAFLGKVFCDRGEYRVVVARPASRLATTATTATATVTDVGAGKQDEWTTGCCG